jgi:uncharacterized protein involved in outer membrane biogenesis
VGNFRTGWRWGRAIRYFAYLTAVLIVVVVAAAVFLPEYLDSPPIRSQIQGKLSLAVGGEVSWESLSVRILPAPRGILHRARVEIPGVVDARAEQMDVRLLFWPLLHGRAEITDVSVARPEIRIDVAPSPAPDGEKKQEDAGEPDPFAAYRSIMQPIVDVVRQFAPDSALTIEDAVVDVRVPGVPPIELRELSLRVNTGSRGMDLEATTAGNYWDRLKLSARVEFADLSGKLSLDARDIRPQAWLDLYLEKSPVRVALPAANMRAQVRTDAKTSLECDFDVGAGVVEVLHARERIRVAGAGLKGKVTAGLQEIELGLDEVRLGASRFHGVKLRYETKNGTLAGGAGFDLDLKQGMDSTRHLVPESASAALARFQDVSGRAHGRVRLASGRSGWHVGVDVLKSDASMQVRDVPGPVRLRSGAVEINPNSVKVERIALSMPAGEVLVSALHYSFRNDAVAGSAGFDVDLAKTLDLVRGALPEENREALAVIQSISGRAQGNTRFAVGGGTWSAGVDILKSDTAVGLRDLPGPVRLTGALVEVDPDNLKITRAALSMLDAQALVSVTISDYRTEQLQATASLSEGMVGEQYLAWVWQLAKAPPHLELKAPVRIAAQRIAWSAKRILDVAATARFAAGPEVAVELGWTPEALDIRRAAIKDERTDATIALRTEGSLLEGRFSGSLYSTSITAMLKSTIVPSGAAAGNLRFTVDREIPRRTSAEGKLKGEALDLAWLLRRPVKIDRIDLAADGSSLQVGEASINWAGQRATIRGEVKLGASGPVIDALLDSSGVVVDALLPREDKTAGEKSPAAEGRSKQAPDDKDELARLWPLPVTGRVAVRSDFVQYGRHRVAPVIATLVLEEQRAHMDLTQAQLCGISLPLTIEATPKGISASAQITAQKQPLQQAAHCLADEHVLITGDFDLQADLKTEGKAGDLVRNLKGTVRADMHDGKVMKFALLGNILSMGDIAALLEKEGPRLDDTGFPYRGLAVAGHFQEGRFIVEESAFNSDAVGLAAKGWISILDYQSRLSVLVAPFGRIDQLARKVPILGYIFGGALTSVPVGVSGDIRDPRVVPLGPGAITSELVGIFERTLKLPGKLIAPLDSGQEAQPPDGK